MNCNFFSRLLVYCFIGITAVQAQQSPLLFKSGPYSPGTTLADYTATPQKWANEVLNHNWYGVFQFNAIPTTEQKDILKRSGVSIVGYIPNNAYVVIVPENFDLTIAKQIAVTRLFQLEPQHKMSASFYAGQIPEWAQSTAETIDMTVELFENTTSENLVELFNNKQIIILNNEPESHKITLRLPAKNRMDIAALPNVLWMEPISPKIVAENIPGKTLHRSNVLNDGSRNLTGLGIRIGIWDGGVVGPHLDFMNRLTVVEPGIATDHGTHVSGTMAGAGNIDPKARGMAPKAEIFGYDFNGSLNTEIANSILLNQIVISQHSYGYGDAFVNCTIKDPYQTNSREQDINIANNPYFLHVHSAGNSQAVCTGGWGTTTGKAAKNTLVVANISSTEAINSSSSFGPVNDGRIKPEISALGVDVYSTLPNNSYVGGYTGTSMATPVVSGVSAQLYERYRQLNANLNPPASLLKAIICNTAKDVGNAGPDYKYGYGVLNGLKAVKALETNAYAVGSLSNATFGSHAIVIPTGTTRVKVTICWTDVPALANANPALVNDLDLVLRDQNSIATLPWVLNAASPASVATRAVDHLNNTEQITIDNPTAGNYTIEVYGFAIPLGMQDYAVTWEIETPYMTLTYPNGNEHLVPGAATTIHWDNAGITSAQTLQYSTNGGSTWTNISTTIASTAKQYAWTVPVLNGAKALIKISSGTYSDVSDSAFNIIGTTGNITYSNGCATGDIMLSWAAVTGATHYDIVSLNSVTGDWDTLVHAGNVVSANVTGLALGQTYWFSIIARNNTAGVIGERSIASSYTVPSTVVTPSVLINSVSQSIPSVCSGGNLTLSASTQLSRAPLANYVFATSTSAVLDPMIGATTVVASNEDDVPSSLIPIGFSFNLNQTEYTDYSVSPDGWLKLGTGVASSQSTNTVTSTTNIPKIYPFWDNLATGIDGNVQTLLTGNAPNRIFIVQWLVTIPRNTVGIANSVFQLWLYETTNKIEFRYGTMGSTTAASASAGITINGSVYRSITLSTNTQSASTSNNANTSPPAMGRLYSFSLPDAPSILWSPSTFLSATSGASVNVVNITAGTLYTITATDAMGCSATNTYSVYVNPKPRAGFTINNTVQPRNTNAFLLTDTTAGTALTRNWNFGDGNNGSANPTTKSYIIPGNYTVKLKATTPLGCSDSIQKTVTVTTSTPTVFASNLQFSDITGTSMRLTWTNGNGQQRFVLAKANTAVSASLTDFTNYPANTQFGIGTPLSDGSFVVYQGTSNTTVITGLSILTNYHFAVVEMSIDNGNMYQPLPYLTGTNTTLPVKWLSFEAALKSNNTVQLNWATASELNNNRFAIERSEDLRNWTAIGSVKGNGTVTTTSHYHFTDEVSLLSSRTIYYRIQQIDFNGKSDYSNIRSVVLSKTTESIVLYPNPVTNTLNINHSFAQGLDIVIQNLNGKVVFEKQHAASNEALDLHELPAGFYIIQLFDNGVQKHSEKLLMQP